MLTNSAIRRVTIQTEPTPTTPSKQLWPRLIGPSLCQAQKLLPVPYTMRYMAVGLKPPSSVLQSRGIGRDLFLASPTIAPGMNTSRVAAKERKLSFHNIQKPYLLTIYPYHGILHISPSWYSKHKPFFWEAGPFGPLACGTPKPESAGPSNAGGGEGACGSTKIQIHICIYM